MKHYLSNLPMLAAQWTRHNYRETNRQRLYLKDIDCPPLWHEKLKEELPPVVFYLNDSVGDIGGIGATEERYANGVNKNKGRGIAKAGDLMSSMPASMRAENLMCYIGHEGTYTPAHKEMCASLGQNIMVETSGSVGEDGKPTKPGSSIWFMTETNDRHLVSEYWLSSLGHDIEVEGHFASIESLIRAPFKVWIAEQKVGDFILIPPLAPHQVWNRGTRTMKVAWNRTTIETLELALKEALPRARMVCRDEQYKNKAIILFTLNKYAAQLRSVEQQKQSAEDESTRHILTASPKIRQLEKDFRRLYALFVEIMVSETLSAPLPKIEYVPYDSNITCSYCRCNIFNRFLTCKHCIIPLENGDEDTYDICMDCYAMGRSCKCLSKLNWAEQFPFRDLMEKFEVWRKQIAKFPDSSSRNTPLPLDQEKARMGKKTLADVCQEQLKLRPFRDPKKPEPVEDKDGEEEDVEVNPDGTVKKKTIKRSEKWYRDHPRCHICMHRHVGWKMATCSCGVSLCYGSLWRAFDVMPQTAMEDPNWRCPKCQKICPCTNCRKDPENQPHEPKGTVLGHDTRKFADPRSVESLVDFSASNMHWIRKTGDDSSDNSRRMLRQVDAAAQEKARDSALGDNYVNSQDDDNMVMDPLLTAPFEENGDEEQVGMQQAAADALTMMGGLSALEKDPQAFITQAGLGRDSYPEHSFEYPDPDDTPSILPTTEYDDSGQGDAKRKKKAGPLVQSDTALSEANAKFQRQQDTFRMKEARRKGHYISTQAAIRGRSLIVRLPIDPARLARFSHQNAPEPVDLEPEASVEAIIVQSDLPKSIPDKVAKSRNPQVPKKRARIEKDDDFVATKREKRGKGSGGQKLTSNIQETPRSDSEAEADAEADVYEEPDYTPPGRRQSDGIASSRRSLPGYLARRSPVNTNEVPNELTGIAPERRKKKRHTVANDEHQRPSPDRSVIAVSMLDRTSPMANARGHDLNGSDPGQQVAILPQRKAPTAPMMQSAPAKNPKVPAPIEIGSDSVPPSSASESPILTAAHQEERVETPESVTSAPTKSNPLPAQVSANVRAKLIAAGQVADDSGSDSTSDSLIMKPRVVSNKPALAKGKRVISDGQTPPSVKRGRGRPPKTSSSAQEAPSLLLAKAPPPPPAERKSIFAKSSRGGKIKITSARAMAKS